MLAQESCPCLVPLFCISLPWDHPCIPYVGGSPLLGGENLSTQPARGWWQRPTSSMWAKCQASQSEGHGLWGRRPSRSPSSATGRCRHVTGGSDSLWERGGWGCPPAFSGTGDKNENARILLSPEKEGNSDRASTQMNLEHIMLREVSQIQKDKCHMTPLLGSSQNDRNRKQYLFLNTKNCVNLKLRRWMITYIFLTSTQIH